MKASSILVCPTVPLRQLPPGEVDVIRRFLFQHIDGLDAQSRARWRRLWGRIWSAEPGEGFPLYNAEERSGPFHRRHRVILERLFDSQERYRHIDKLHDFLKVGAGFVDWEAGRDHKPVAIPRSTSFPECSEDEMREFHKDALEFLHTPFAQRRLWTHVKPSQRPAMLEAVLADRERDST